MRPTQTLPTENAHGGLRHILIAKKLISNFAAFRPNIRISPVGPRPRGNYDVKPPNALEKDQKNREPISLWLIAYPGCGSLFQFNEATAP